MNNKTILLAGMALLTGAAPAAAQDWQDESWHEIGACTLRDDLVTTYWYISNYEFQALMYESDETPGRYFIENPYAQYPMNSQAALLNHRHGFVVDASDPDHVWIEKGCLGLNLSEGADGWEYVVWSKADNEYNNIWGDWDIVEEEAGVIWGTLFDGSITFPAGSLLIHYYQPPAGYVDDPEAVFDPDGDWTLPNDGYRPSNPDGKFRILLPGAPRYDIGITRLEDTIGEGENEIDFNFSISFDTDVAFVRYGMCAGDDPADLTAELRAGGGERLDRPAADMFGYVADVVSVAYDGDGPHVFAAVPFNADGEPRTPQYVAMEFNYDQSEWKKCGYARYTEAVLSSNEVVNNVLAFFGPKECTYEVEVEMNVQKPGLMRLVDPYGLAYPQCFEEIYDMTRRYYLEVDATDPECAHIPYTVSGTGIDTGYGPCYIWSRANRSLTERGESKEKVMADGTNGTFDTAAGVVTFPRESLLLEFNAAMGNIYWANLNGHFRIELPQAAMDYYNSQSGVAPVAGAECPEAWYTLDGVRVAEPAGHGVYIRRIDGKTRKIIK